MRKPKAKSKVKASFKETDPGNENWDIDPIAPGAETVFKIVKSKRKVGGRAPKGVKESQVGNVEVQKMDTIGLKRKANDEGDDNDNAPKNSIEIMNWNAKTVENGKKGKKRRLVVLKEKVAATEDDCGFVFTRTGVKQHAMISKPVKENVETLDIETPRTKDLVQERVDVKVDPKIQQNIVIEKQKLRVAKSGKRKIESEPVMDRKESIPDDPMAVDSGELKMTVLNPQSKIQDISKIPSTSDVPLDSSKSDIGQKGLTQTTHSMVSSENSSEMNVSPCKPVASNQKSLPQIHTELKLESRYVSSTLGGANIEIEIPLPVSETPMIKKNKEMRNSSRRRSSFSLRGRRAESLSGGAFVLPHSDIEAQDYHRHISAELPDPVRIKQLLLWCGKKAMDEFKLKASTNSVPLKKEDANVMESAILIQKELLKSLAANKINTSWYHQTAITVEETPIEKKENPRNIANLRKIEEYQEMIKRFKSEEDSWMILLRRVSSLHASVVDSLHTKPQHTDPLSPLALTKEEQMMLKMCSGSPKAKPNGNTPTGELELERLGTQVLNLEHDITKLFHIMYHFSQFNHVAEEFGDNVFCDIHKYLDDKYLIGNTEKPAFKLTKSSGTSTSAVDRQPESNGKELLWMLGQLA